jgi:hypothetical protein
MTDPHVFRNKDGNFAWLRDESDAVAQACAEICERMEGYSDIEIDAAVQKYLGQLYAQGKGRMN